MTQLIKQKFNQWFDKEDKSKLSLGVAEQLAREYGGEGDIRVIKHRKLAPPLGPGGAMGATSPAGLGGSPCRGPPTILTLFHPLTSGLGGGTGPRWGVGGILGCRPRGRLPRLCPSKPAGARRGCRTWRASNLKSRMWGPGVPCSRPRQGALGPTLKQRHPGAGVQARWGLMHLMLQWVSHHEHPANPRPWGG